MDCTQDTWRCLLAFTKNQVKMEYSAKQAHNFPRYTGNIFISYSTEDNVTCPKGPDKA